MYQFPHIDYNDHILCIELLPLEQPGMLKSQDYKNNKVMHHFSWRLLYVIGIGLDIVTSTV